MLLRLSEKGIKKCHKTAVRIEPTLRGKQKKNYVATRLRIFCLCITASLQHCCVTFICSFSNGNGLFCITLKLCSSTAGRGFKIDLKVIQNVTIIDYLRVCMPRKSKRSLAGTRIACKRFKTSSRYSINFSIAWNLRLESIGILKLTMMSKKRSF